MIDKDTVLRIYNDEQLMNIHYIYIAKMLCIIEDFGIIKDEFIEKEINENKGEC